MKRKILACLMCVLCLLSAVGCARNEPAATSSVTTVAEAAPVTAAPETEAQTEAETTAAEDSDYLASISGTYVELFPELSKAEYREMWINATTPLVGAESMAFDCYFLGGVHKFVMDGQTITGLDEEGKQVFSHSYKAMNLDNENGFIFYESEDADSGEFTYFAFSPDSMDTTYHLEFRYAEDIDDLQSWFAGNYAYWNAAGIAENYDLQTMQNVIELFATENLSSEE